MMSEKVFVSFDGKEIHYREWKPEGEVKGILQIVHGMAEGISRYEGIGEFMSSKGYLVFGDDHRAHGATDPGRTGYCDGDVFHDTLRDLDGLSKEYKSAYPGVPLVVFGHSYGSFLTQRYIQLYGADADGFIVGGSAYMKDITVPAGRLVSAFGCLFGRKKKPAKLLNKASFDVYNKKFAEGTFISSIKSECDRYYASPDCAFLMSNGFYKYFFKGVSELYKKKNYSAIDVEKPIFIISGKDDPVGNFGKNVDKLYDFYKSTVGVKSVEEKLYDGVRHEYLNDTSRSSAYGEILRFCDKACAK